MFIFISIGISYKLMMRFQNLNNNVISLIYS